MSARLVLPTQVEAGIIDAYAAEVAESFGPRLRQALERRGMSARKLAFSIGTSASAMQFITCGKRRPGLKLIARIAAFMGCSYDELFDGRFEPSAQVTNRLETAECEEAAA